MTRARWLGPAIAMSLSLAGCSGLGGRGAGGGSRVRTARRVTTRSSIDRVSLPYPVGEPIKQHSGPRIALGRSAFARLDVATEGTSVVTHVLTADAPAYAKVLELVPRLDRTRPSATPVEAEALATAEVASPGDSVLVIGTQGPCRATIGEAGVVVDDPGASSLTVRWSLSGCDDAGALAPVAVLTDRLPEALRWSPAARTVDLVLVPGAPWSDPRAAATTTAAWGGGGVPTAHLVQVFEVAGLLPTPTQIYDALVLREADAPDPCRDRDAWAQTNGLWRETWLDPFEPSPEASATPQLVGAFGHDGILDAIVYLDHEQPLVVVPPTTGPDGEATTWVYRYAAPDDPSALARPWAWSPATGEPGYPPACDVASP